MLKVCPRVCVLIVAGRNQKKKNVSSSGCWVFGESLSENLLSKAKCMECPCGVAFEAWGIATGKLQLLGASQKKTEVIEYVRDDN